MRTAIIIPTLNAQTRGEWHALLASVSGQTLAVERKIVIDSSSQDATCAVAAAFGWECRKIPVHEFNHGRTRDAAVRELAQEGIDTVIFLSQDVVLATPDALLQLTDYLWKNPVAGCFGKQCARQEHSLNAWQRNRCYPEQSEVKFLHFASSQGMMRIFFSNAFAAWKTAEVIRYGGFSETGFGEDMLLAATILNHGGAVGYCAAVKVFHDHSNSPRSLFLRGRQIGIFHRRHPELLQQFGGKTIRTAGKIPCTIWLPLIIKFFGYLCGRMFPSLIPAGLFFLMWLLLLTGMVLYDFPLRDVAERYAPMAEAFARGEWQFAFHPRVLPLFPATAGLIAGVSGCRGDMACQLAAFIFLTLGVFPLYYGCRRIYGNTVANIAGALYVFCAPFLRIGYYGLRESVCIAGVALLLDAGSLLYRQKKSFRGFWRFAIAIAILLLSRGDVALFALLASLWLFFHDMNHNDIPWRSIAAGAIVLLLLTPQLVYNYRTIGYPVPEVRHALIWRAFSRKLPILKRLENPHPAMALDMARESKNE